MVTEVRVDCLHGYGTLDATVSVATEVSLEGVSDDVLFAFFYLFFIIYRDNTF